MWSLCSRLNVNDPAISSPSKNVGTCFAEGALLRIFKVPQGLFFRFFNSNTCSVNSRRVIWGGGVGRRVYAGSSDSECVTGVEVSWYTGGDGWSMEHCGNRVVYTSSIWAGLRIGEGHRSRSWALLTCSFHKVIHMAPSRYGVKKDPLSMFEAEQVTCPFLWSFCFNLQLD